RPGRSPDHYLWASKAATLFWGLLAILFATFGTLFENLIQLVNIIGSIFYGTILGIFLVAFYIRWVKANAVFIAALIAESIVIYLYFTSDIGFLWYNVIGCGLVVAMALVFQGISQLRTSGNGASERWTQREMNARISRSQRQRHKGHGLRRRNAGK